MAERNAARATDRYERKREDILDAATLILNQKGVKGLTLSLAAGAVGLSTTSVTYYFKRKDDLAAACLMRGVEWLIHLAVSADADAPSGSAGPDRQTGVDQPLPCPAHRPVPSRPSS